jgi:hypothetical protein
MQRRSLSENIHYYFWNSVSATIGFGSSIPNAQYAMSITGNVAPTTATASWLVSLPLAKMIGSIYAGASTLSVSGVFGYRFVHIAKLKLQEEWHLFRQGKNTKRFLTETTMAFLAGITGGSIAGNPYSGALKWGARFLGFSIIFSLSFIGMCELIIKLTDENYAFKLKIIDLLKHLNSRYRQQVDALLGGKELNNETLSDFLNALMDLGGNIQERGPILSEDQEIAGPLFQKKTRSEYKKEQIRTLGDFGMSTVLTACCSFIYIEGGFLGTNVLFNDLLKNISDVLKILIGIPTALPLALFVFFNIKILNSPVIDLSCEIRNDSRAILKTLVLTGLNVGNAFWYCGLAKMTAENENIFLGALDNSFGKILFPGLSYVTCFVLGINGLTPMLFPPNIKIQDPNLDDVIKYLNYHFPSTVMEGLRKHSYFTKQSRNSKEPIELEEKKEAKGPNELEEIQEVTVTHIMNRK